MPKKSYQLLVVAHPDDETIYFGGLLLKERKIPWKLVVLTDGNADGQATRRTGELTRAAKSLGVKDFEQWNFKDIFQERLPIADISSRLKNLATPTRVFTHGPIGEYGHPHHQDACVACIDAFAPRIPIFSPSYNTASEIHIRLDKKQYAIKSKLFVEKYFDETKRFIHFLPALPSEDFFRLDAKEARRIYQFFLDGTLPQPKELKHYRWFLSYLPFYRELIEKRPF